MGLGAPAAGKVCVKCWAPPETEVVAAKGGSDCTPALPLDPSLLLCNELHHM